MLHYLQNLCLNNSNLKILDNNINNYTQVISSSTHYIYLYTESTSNKTLINDFTEVTSREKTTREVLPSVIRSDLHRTPYNHTQPQTHTMYFLHVWTMCWSLERSPARLAIRCLCSGSLSFCVFVMVVLRSAIQSFSSSLSWGRK